MHPSQSMKGGGGGRGGNVSMILKTIEIIRSSITTPHIKTIPITPSSDFNSDPKREHQKKEGNGSTR